VLEIAAATTKPVRISTRRRDAVRRWCHNFHNVSSIKACTHTCYFYLNRFTWNRVANKDHRTLMACDEVAAMGDFFNLNPYSRPHLDARFLG
jgi:hypothetical protein